MKIVTVHLPDGFPGALHEDSFQSVWTTCEDAEQVLYTIMPGDDFAYGQILKGHWNVGWDLCIVEPDIVVNPDTITGFRDCPEPYCAAPYAWTTDVGPALGCTRFKQEFMAKYPNVMRDAVGTNVTWRQLDVVIMRHILARDLGAQPHIHEVVTHLNPLKQLLPEASPVPLTTVPHW